MAQSKYKNLRVGSFIFIALVLFIGAILILGQKQNLFQQSIRISAVFSDVSGLQVGNNVRFTGIQVGTIMNIKILSDTSVNVDLSINKDVVPYIKKDSKATIGTEGLMGNTIVILLPGTSGTLNIEPGDQLPSINPVSIDDIIREIKTSSEKISMVANNLIEITEKINRGDGIFGKLFTDSDLTSQIDRTGENIASLSNNLSQITNRINDGRGTVGKLFVDTTFSKQLDSAIFNVKEISHNLEEFTNRINRSEGILGNLLVDTAINDNFYQASRNLETVLSNLSEVSVKLNDNSNALNRFIADPAFADSVDVMLNNLNKGIIEVTDASEALQNSGMVRAFSRKAKKNKKQASEPHE
jgi:phospholipid/cholesterol/gamma-HCH transport system substrate-binding protein